MTPERCIICGLPATHQGDYALRRAGLCLEHVKAWDESGEHKRVRAMQLGLPLDVRKAVAFVDFLNRVLGERRNHGNEVKR